ncbi:hypothetical protein CkaCkLH20_04210 [Colletotrichum karsti]|uniref:6-phosphogluconolactonase n=1 Tax=Colletotrichum karsti TaxID=1095194 RepID=A0A9P6I776_9PEZI|nr:uncharacterized protein CkaCkLH20_04210 [Colletotrichum karsti]KAF9878172.1 hypothetical protein CkaCkLH20_04210 [Colletotrichum karsti]
MSQLAHASVTAVNLYAGANDGNLTSLRLTSDSRGKYALEKTHVTDQGGPQAVWLDLDVPNRVLYCLDRSGTANTFAVSGDGALRRIARVNTTLGPVSSAFYNTNENRGLILAHYAGSAVTAWNAPPNGNLSLIQTLIYNSPTGPRPSQNVSHPHDAIVDPTGKFIVVPDLGGDILRVYTFDQQTNLLTQVDQFPTPTGSGPRHGLFWAPSRSSSGGDGPLYFHVLSELDSTVTSFRVTYPAAGRIAFANVGVVSAYGTEPAAPNGIGAEIEVSPDNRFIMVSNRNDSSFSIPNLDPANRTAEASDSLAVFKPADDGALEFVQLAPAGGIWPRHFKMNKAGDLVAVSLQYSYRVAILARNVSTGVLGPFLAHVDGVGEVVTAVWDE